MQFIGRGHTVAAPQAMDRFRALSGSAGLRAGSDCRDPLSDHPRAGRDRSPSISSSGMATTREPPASGRQIPGPASRGSCFRSGMDTQPSASCGNSMPPKPTRNSMDDSPVPSSMPMPPCAPKPAVLSKNRRGQSGLWGYAISGDLPIVLLQIADPATSTWSASSYRPMRTGV